MLSYYTGHESLPWLLSQALAVGGLAPQHGWQVTVSPNMLCWEHGVTRRRKRPVQSYGRVLGCILLAWVLGQELTPELTSPPQRAIHTDLYFAYEAKKIRLAALQTASGTFCLPVLPSLKDILR